VPGSGNGHATRNRSTRDTWTGTGRADRQPNGRAYAPGCRSSRRTRRERPEIRRVNNRVDRLRLCTRARARVTRRTKANDVFYLSFFSRFVTRAAAADCPRRCPTTERYTRSCVLCRDADKVTPSGTKIYIHIRVEAAAALHLRTRGHSYKRLRYAYECKRAVREHARSTKRARSRRSRHRAARLV